MESTKSQKMFNNPTEFVYMSALRYAFERNTGMLGIIVDEIERNIEKFSAYFLSRAEEEAIAVEDIVSRLNQPDRIKLIKILQNESLRRKEKIVLTKDNC